MTHSDQSDPQDGQWYRDPNYTMDDWGYQAANGDDPPDYLLWVLQRYEGDDLEPPQSLLEEIERIGGAVQSLDIHTQVPDEFRERYPVEDWQYEAENNDTRLGYRTWLAHRLEEDEEWESFVANRPAAISPAGPKGP